MKSLLFLLLLNPIFAFAQSEADDLEGAWETTFLAADGDTNQLSMIIEDGYFVMTAYNLEDKEFISTLGGSYAADAKNFTITYEWDSSNPANVGTSQNMPYALDGSLLVFNGDKAWARVDDGSGPLAGAWQITGRMRDGELSPIQRNNGPRKTMKILSGSRFQWIAFNTETAEMVGTGGGTYTSEAPIYVEQIQFFSRDPERVGDELSFNFEIKDNEWHHSGKSSKGDPLYETWGHRQ